MSAGKNAKLRNLLSVWPKHTLAPVRWLTSQGYSVELIKRYISSGWFERKSHGLIQHAGDLVEWTGAVWGLQKVENAVVGGKTALEILGVSHYVSQHNREVYLFIPNSHRPPRWAEKLAQETSVKFISSNLFPSESCIQEAGFGEYSLRISNQARAMCEYIYLLDKSHTHEEAYHLMENLNALSPKIVQDALEDCNSVKVKRLFLCLAKIQNPNWYSKLDLSKIDLGSGKRHLDIDGIFDADYGITYPKSWKKIEDDESIF